MTFFFGFSLINMPFIKAYADTGSNVTMLFQDNFQDGDYTTPAWITNGGAWTVKTDTANPGNQVLSQSITDQEAYITVGDSSWTDYTYSIKIRQVDGSAYPGIVGRYTDTSNYYMFRLNPSNNTLELSKKVSNTSSSLGSISYNPLTKGIWYTMKMMLQGSSIKCYLNDELVFAVTDTSLTAGEIGIRSRWGSFDVDDALVTTNSIPELTVQSAIQDSAVLQYNFDETSGTSAMDLSGHNNDGTLYGGASWSAGKNDGAVKLNGSNGYVKIPNGILNGLNNVTITGYVNVGNVVTNQWVFGLGPDSSKYIFINAKSGSGNVRGAITTNTWSGEQGVDSSPSFPQGVWKHFALVISGDTKQEKLYIDGLLAAINNNVTLKPSQIYDAAKDFSGYIGKSLYSGDPYFNGTVDDFRIYNRALNSAEIQTIVNAKAVEVPTANIVAMLGVPQNMPGKVLATYTDGSTKNANVTWNPVDPANFDNIGQFQVEGKLTGTDIKVEAIVHVMGDVKIKVTDKTDTTISLGWAPVSGAVMYKVYRSTTSGSGYSCVYTGTDANFTDSGLGTGMTYYYTMSYIIDTLGESVMSPEVAVTTNLAVQTAIQNNAVLEYNFDETSGTTAIDISGRNNDGSLYGGASWSIGKNDGAVKLDGSSGYVKIPNGILNGLNNITITGNVNVSNVVKNQWVFGLGSDSNKYIFINAQSGSGNVRGAITTSTYTGEQGVDSSPSFPQGVWKHFALVISGDTKQEILYLDGVQAAVNNNITLTPSQIYDAAKDFSGYIGKSLYSGDPYFNGTVDDFRIYNRALTSTEIQTIVNSKLIEVPTVNISAKVGLPQDMPSKVLGTFSDGSSKNVSVTWDTVDSSNYDTIGQLQVEGTLNGTSTKVQAIVHVMEPITITSTGKTKSTIDLGWEEMAGATSYCVYRSSTSGTGYSRIYRGTNTNYTDSGLVTGETYYYVVTYTKDGVESPKSDELSVTTILVKPDTPIAFAQGTLTSRFVVLKWNTSAIPAVYEVYRSESKNGDYTLVKEVASNTYTDTNLSPDTTYFYSVSAKNAAGESEKSYPITVKTSPLSDTVANGVAWYDNNGNVIDALGGNILKLGDTYYFYGQTGACGVSAYSSKDLVNWTFENKILSNASLGLDGNPAPDLISAKTERPKVVYDEKLNKYVLIVHYENGTDYNLGRVGVAMSDTPTGNFTWIGSYRPDGIDSRDMTVYKDDDGSVYLISATKTNAKLSLFKFSDDYTSATQLYNIYGGLNTDGTYVGREAPAIVKKNGIYYLITSQCSGWYPNQAKYSTASVSSLAESTAASWSPMTNIGSSAAFWSQSTFILPVTGSKGTSYILMSDRNAIPGKSADPNFYNVWFSLQLDTGKASFDYADKVRIDVNTGEIENVTPGSLISQGKPAQASTSAAGYPASLANDGDYNTEWIASGVLYPSWWNVDLGQVYNINEVQLNWFLMNGSEATEYYQILVSDNGVDYTVVLNNNTNTNYGFNNDKFTNITGRYVKVQIDRSLPQNNPSNSWYTPQLYEVKVYGTPVASAFGMGAAPFLIKGENTVSSVKLQWPSVGDATKYVVSRSENSGDYKVFNSISGTSYDDHELQEGTIYKYQVQAYNGDVLLATANSAEVKAYTIPENLNTYDNITPSSLKIFSDLKIGDTYYRFNYVSKTNGESGFKELVQQTSKDGINYGDDKVVLSYLDNPDLNYCKFEATSIVYNEKTNRFIIWTHYENNVDYSLGRVAVAYAVPGESFQYIKSFRPFGNDSRDLGFFKDEDGSAYLISTAHTNADMILYKLTEDWLDVEKQVTTIYTNMYREAPSLIKKDGIYYLFTSQAAGWYPSKSMYSSAASIEGPWSQLRTIGSTSTFSAQSGGLVHLKGDSGDNYAMMANRWMFGWKDATNPIHQQRMLPISFTNGYAFFDFYEDVLYDAEKGIVIPEQNGKILSQGKPAVSSSNSDTASKANDGDYQTEWVGSGVTWPSSWAVDLGNVYNLSEIQISWFLWKGSEAYYQYTVEGSIDGETYTTLLDKSTGYNDYGFTADNLTGLARFVRVTMVNAKLQNNSNNWYTPQLYEVKVYGGKVLGDVTVQNDKTYLKPGDVTKLTVTGVMENGAQADLSIAQIVYSSDNEEIASVDENGTVTAIEEGTANIKTVVTLYDETKESTSQITVDNTPPVTIVKVNENMVNEWYDVDAVVELTSEDKLSGVDRIEYRIGEAEEWMPYNSPIILEQQGTYTLQYRSIDKVGNIEEAKTQIINIDKTKPDFELKVNNNVLNDGGSFEDYLHLTFKAWDDFSGIASAKIYIDGTDYSINSEKQSVDIDMEGKPRNFTAVVTIVDKAGNIVETPLRFNVTTSIDSMKQLINSFIKTGELSGPIVQQLTNDLEQAQHQLDIGRAEHAAKHIQDFIDRLNNKALSEFSSDKARTVLNADANYLINN